MFQMRKTNKKQVSFILFYLNFFCGNPKLSWGAFHKGSPCQDVLRVIVKHREESLTLAQTSQTR